MSKMLLIVDDSSVAGTALEIALQTMNGYDVRLCSTGKQALELLEGQESTNVCALLTDLNMPRLDGFELIERMRKLPAHSATPVIVLSADTDPHTPERLKPLGVSAYFRKPYSPAAVRTKLQELIA